MAREDWFGLRSYRPFTVTIAAPGVFTSDSHGLELADKIQLTTTGALPTGLSVDTYYYVIEGTYSDGSTDYDTFKLASSKANAEAGTAITTTGSQSGAHYYSSSKRPQIRPFEQDNH